MKVKQIISKFLDSNTFVCIQGDECLIVDAGAGIEEIKKVVLGHRVVGVLLTHGHYDHAFYALDYAKEFGCKIYINENGKRTLETFEENYGQNFSISDFKDFVFLSGDGKFSLGEFEISYFSTPGHSKCCSSFLIENHIFAGDLVFRTGIGRTDLLGGSDKDMLESLKKISTLSFEILHSGHGSDSTHTEQERNLNAYMRFLSRKV